MRQERSQARITILTGRRRMTLTSTNCYAFLSKPPPWVLATEPNRTATETSQQKATEFLSARMIERVANHWVGRNPLK